jgi:hypothetical protein
VVSRRLLLVAFRVKAPDDMPRVGSFRLTVVVPHLEVPPDVVFAQRK